MTARHSSDFQMCYLCDRVLTDYEEIYCGPCQSKVLRELDPTDDDLARRDAMISRGYRHLAAILAGATFAAALIVGALTHVTPTAAQDTNLIYTSPNGHTLELPYIGTPEYSRSCEITRAWEDSSAVATCWEDNGTYRWDPEDGRWYTMSGTR